MAIPRYQVTANFYSPSMSQNGERVKRSVAVVGGGIWPGVARVGPKPDRHVPKASAKRISKLTPQHR
jgi:hypothetical protein